MAAVGLWGLLHIAAVVFAMLRIVDSGVPTLNKVLWIIVVAVLPVVGLLAWLFMGPGTPRK